MRLKRRLGLGGCDAADSLSRSVALSQAQAWPSLRQALLLVVCLLIEEKRPLLLRCGNACF
jgi:hypothetical protein